MYTNVACMLIARCRIFSEEYMVNGNLVHHRLKNASFAYSKYTLFLTKEWDLLKNLKEEK